MASPHHTSLDGISTPYFTRWHLHTILHSMASPHHTSPDGISTPYFTRWHLHTILHSMASPHHTSLDGISTPYFTRWHLHTILHPMASPHHTVLHSPSCLFAQSARHCLNVTQVVGVGLLANPDDAFVSPHALGRCLHSHCLPDLPSPFHGLLQDDVLNDVLHVLHVVCFKPVPVADRLSFTGWLDCMCPPSSPSPNNPPPPPLPFTPPSPLANKTG
jgi:hypothetical protein